MTWNNITPQKFVELVNYWVNQDWPLTEDKLAAAMERLGWDESACIHKVWQASYLLPECVLCGPRYTACNWPVSCMGPTEARL